MVKYYTAIRHVQYPRHRCGVLMNPVRVLVAACAAAVLALLASVSPAAAGTRWHDECSQRNSSYGVHLSVTSDGHKTWVSWSSERPVHHLKLWTYGKDNPNLVVVAFSRNQGTSLLPMLALHGVRFATAFFDPNPSPVLGCELYK
ncbi:MAG TPA: hypothetical protein VI322_03145 [Candidatus Saccharimonadia bacterium]